MITEKSLLESSFKTKFHLLFWTAFWGFLGGFVAVLILTVSSFASLVFLDSKGIGLGILLFPYVLASGSLWGSYKFLNSNGVDKQKLNKTYSVLISLTLIAFSAYYLFSFMTKQAVRPHYSDFARALNEGDFSTAYSFMSPAYRQTNSLETFAEDAQYLFHGDQYRNWPPLWTIDVDDFGRKATINYDARNYLDIERTGSNYLFLEKIDGIWYFTGKVAWGGG